MEIQILGSASGLPTLGKHHAGIYIKLDGKRVLLDCGEGISQQLLKYNLSKDKLDVIAISHFHPDHVCGLYMVLQMLFLQNRTKDLIIFLPEEIEDFRDSLRMFYIFEQKFDFKVNFKLTENINSYLPEISTIFSEHLISYKDLVEKYKFKNNYNAYSFKIKHNNKSVIYTADISNIKHLEKYLTDLDMLIIDGLHPDYKQILSLRDKTRARIIVNHGLSPELEGKIEKYNYEIADERKKILL